MPTPLLAVEIRHEPDVVSARQRARQIAELLGFGEQDQTRIATAVSEIARNAYRYGGGGRAEYLLDGSPPEQTLRIAVADRGAGMEDVQAVLEGRHRSQTGMGLGIAGARRLMDGFHIESAPGRGTRVELGKRLPRTSPGVDAQRVAYLIGQLASRRPQSVFEELQQQNRELLRALGEVRAREQDLLQLNRELEDTNRGVVALYAELDERVEQLRRSNALRAQFTSYLSHEFRTPLDSMLALSGLLLNRVDGELTEEQEKQVKFLRRSARDLLDMVDDLLDTARVDAGQVQVRPVRFGIADLFSALRATLRPLLTTESVSLVFQEAAGVPEMVTDEAKVTQILRNLISNALKFTERGEIRVRADALDGGQRVRLSVADTGIGVAPEKQQWIFEDFAQIDGVVQRKVKGTGLGLPLSRKLARLLGGEVYVESGPGAGSVFSVVLPREYRPAADGPAAADHAGG